MTHLEYFEIISKMKRHGTTNLLALIPIFGIQAALHWPRWLSFRRISCISTCMNSFFEKLGECALDSWVGALIVSVYIMG